MTSRLSDARSGVFLVRVWLENGSPRARITESLDLPNGPETVTLTDRLDEVEGRLHEWLVAFAGRNAAITPP